MNKNILHNGVANIIQKSIKIGEQLLLVPFFINAWGAAYYGEWLTLTIIPTMLALSDFGFGSAAANSFVLNYAGGNIQKAANIAKSGRFSITIIIAVSIVLSVVVLAILAHYRVFDKSLIPQKDAIMAVSLLMFARIISFYNPLNEAYFKAVRKAALNINIITVYSSFNLLGAIIVLSIGGTIVHYALTNAIISVIFVIVYTIIAHKYLDIKKQAIAVLDKNEINVIFKKGFGYLLSPVWQAIFFQGTTFVVRLTLGPVAVTVFNTVRTLTRSVNQANAILIGASMPEIQYEIGAGNLDKAKRIFIKTMYAVAGVAIIGIIFLYFFGPAFYEWWTQKALTPPTAMWNIFLVGIFFNAMWWLIGDVLINANRPYAFTLPATIITIFSVIICYFLSKTIGITGAALSCLFFDFTLFVNIIPKSIKLFKLNYHEN